MSGNADSIGPNEGEVSTANISAADEEDYSENLTTRCLVKDNGDHPLLTSATKSDSPLNPELEASEDFEAVIEKKLNPEKEKALDIDSELDFELKWDDDALNDDETDSKSDDAQCVTTENETIEEDNIIESQINPDNDESNNGNMNKVLDTVDKTPPDDEHTSDIKILESKVNTNMKINLASKLLMDSENSSLDEQLVYSDVDVPDIEDKQLLDEIDAHISDKTANDENTNVETSRSPTAMPELNLEKSIGEGFSQQDLNSTEMDVDVEHAIKISDTIEKIDVNDTCSTITDMETSSYEINVQHKLVKLDAMIEIPTQELIEEFDDSGELSEGAEQYDEELLLQNHPKQQDNSSGSIKDVDNIKTSEQVKPEDETLVKQVINIEEQSPDVKETLVANAVNEMVEVIQTENTEMKSSSPDNNEHNDNLDIKDIEITDGERHAMHGIIIEAAQQEPVNLKEMKDEKNDSEPTEKLNAENSSFLELGLIAKLPAALTETVSTIDAKAEVNLTADTSIKEIEITEDIQSKMIIEEEDITSVAAVDNLEPREPTETKCILSSNVEPKKIDIKTKEELKVDDSSGDIEPKGHKESKKEVPTNLDSKENIESKGDGSTDDMDSKGNMKTKDISSVDDRKVDKEIKNVIPTDDLEAKMDIENKEVSSTDNLEPKADIEAEDANSTDDALPKKTAEMKNVGFIDPAQPSTSNLLQELSDEDQVTDSLGLLAESSRVMDDDDEQEQEDDDDDEDFDQDDESNQMTAEHSEDSSAQQSETDAPQESMDVDQTTDVVKETIQCQTPEPVSSKITEPVEPIVAESVEAMEDEVESAVLALMSSNATEELTDMPDPPRADGLSAEGQAKLDAGCKLRELLTRSTSKEDAAQSTEKSPSKVKKLEISRPNHEYSIVDLEESSSEDDVQEVCKRADSAAEAEAGAGAGAGAEAAPVKLDTSEGTVKAAPPQIPPTVTPTPEPQQPKLGLEIFNLDSDDDEKDKDSAKAELGRDASRCINAHCTSGAGVPRVPADAAAAAHYGAARRRAVCAVCARAVRDRTESLIAGVRELTPLLSLDMGQVREELVEISDSESDSEADAAGEPADAIGEAAAKFLEANLEEVLNATWLKYNLDSRLQEAQVQLDLEVSQLEDECKQIDAMLGECQSATDRLRRDLYATFQHERQELPAIIVYDTPTNMWCSLEESILANEKKESRQSKRRLQASAEPAAKRAAIPLEYSPLDKDGTHKEKPAAATDSAIQNDDDSADISVVRSSAEAAPAGLPPPGAPSRPPLRAQAPVYAMRNAFGAWLRARVVDVLPRTTGQFTMCRVKFEHKVKSPFKLLPARCLAYDQPSDVRMTIGTRVIALFADTQSTTKSYYSGIIAEIPNPVNNYRYLVFFDDGYAQYVQHAHTRPVCECAPLVWDEVHPLSRQFVRDYLRAYPERPMVRAHAGQSLKTEWNGKWWVSRVLQVDASLVQVHFEEDDRTEWIYRGSTRLAPLYLELQAAERQRARPLPRAQPGRKVNMPYVEYTRSDEPAPAPAAAPASAPAPAAATATAQLEDVRRQRAVAKKSTAQAQPAPPAALDGVSSRVVFYTPKNAIRPLKMVPHTCGPRCRRTDVLALKDLRTYNPLTKPLLSGWERQIVKYRFTKAVVYRAPCGRRVRDARELHRYLRAVGSDMPVDLFDFGPHTHCLAEFVLNKCLVSKKDLSHGKENVPVPCVNYYDSSLPEFCSYSTERTPTAGVPLNLDPEFLCGCDCADDCADKQKCACWRMTLEGARTIGLDSEQVGYVYKRLPEPLPSGIYECNSRCKCKNTCLNRVAQHPLQLKLQVFKTLNRGWGIRALNDVPKGAFLCVYAGNLLTDATANLDGLNEGDEYLAELDYIEVVEQMKEGYEEDIPEADKKLDEEESSESASSSEEERAPPADDEEFRPAERLPRATGTEYSKRLRKREKKKKEGEDKEKTKQKEKEGNTEDNCITISDDEELREPARFAAQAGMGGKEFVSKYKSVRAHFGKDEACYIMDAKVQGNIGRYLNHSCTPNVFVQNVFVDTHDPRFPWVAFFALTHIRAGTELTWNYNYDVGSVPGKVLYCHCAAPNCRGRLL